MKGLTLLSLLSLTFSTLTYANEKNSSLDSYISDLKKQEFDLNYKKNELDSLSLRDSWITPLKLSYTYSRTNPYDVEYSTHMAAIKMDQPIFKSGGIYYGIKFAQHSKKYADYSIDVAKRKLIKDAISTLMQIKQTTFKIKKQKLQIENSEINLKSKKEQYLNGQLDSGFLDNAIIKRNVVIQTLYDLQTSKERLINVFTTLSDLNYETATIPHLELLSKDEFLKQNIVLKKAQSQIKKDMYAKNMVVTQYLPEVDFTANYNWNKSKAQLIPEFQERDYYSYGFRATIPFSINTFRDIESSQVDYLSSKILKDDKKRELTALFKQVIQNIENYDKKRLLSIENKEIYAKLLVDTKDLYVAGYKTEYDVKTLENSVQISEINCEIYEIDKQLELLTLYEMYVNDF